MIRIFALQACLGRTIETSFACVWVLAAHRLFGLFLNLLDPGSGIAWPIMWQSPGTRQIASRG
jgi:hypothetical protein